MAVDDEYFVKPTAGGFVCQAVEFRHAALLSPLRFCNDTVDRTLPIEAGAPADASTDQVFLAAAIEFGDGEQSGEGLPEHPLSVADNAASFQTMLKPAVDSDTPVSVSLREYVGTVAAPILKTAIHGLELRGGAGRLDAASVYKLGFRRLTQERIPRAVYDAETAPGLLV